MPDRGTSRHALYAPELAYADTQRVFADQLRSGAEILSACSNLLLRSFQSSERGLVDVVALGHFYRALIVAADGCLICLEAGAAEQALLHTRKALEAGIQLQWLLQADSESRAKRFYVWHLREERSWLLRAIPGSPENEEHLRAWAAEGDPGPSLDPTENRRLVDGINRVLDSDQYRDVNVLVDEARVERKTRRGGRHDPPWYGVGADKQQNFAALATATGRRTDYRTTYKYLSYAAHSSSLTSSAHFRESEMTLEHVRVPRHFSTAFVFAFVELLNRSLEVAARYRPGEGSWFAVRMRDDWFKHVTKWYNVELGSSDTAT